MVRWLGEDKKPILMSLGFEVSNFGDFFSFYEKKPEKFKENQEE